MIHNSKKKIVFYTKIKTTKIYKCKKYPLNKNIEIINMLSRIIKSNVMEKVRLFIYLKKICNPYTFLALVIIVCTNTSTRLN